MSFVIIAAALIVAIFTVAMVIDLWRSKARITAIGMLCIGGYAIWSLLQYWR